MHKDIEEKVLMKKKQSTSTLNLACHFTFLRPDVSVLKLEIEYPISTSITTLAHLFKSTKYFKPSPFKWYQQFLGLTIRQNGSHHVEAHEKDISDILFQFRSALHWEICSISRQKQQKSAYKLIGLLRK